MHRDRSLSLRMRERMLTIVVESVEVPSEVPARSEKKMTNKKNE